MIKKFLHILGVLLAIGSVVWIITGSTVVFHQKYVYHNLLTVWQDMFLKTGSKDSKKYFKLVDKCPQFSIADSFAANSDDDSGRNNINFTRKNIPAGYVSDLLTPEYIVYKPHRGPPVL